jgi:NAD+ diphosphatase
MLLPEGFTPLWSAPTGEASAGLWFVFRDRQFLFRNGPAGPEILAPGPDGSPPVPVEGVRCIGLLGGRPCWAAEATTDALPEGASREPVRRLFDRLDDGMLALAGRAGQVLEFDRTRRYCGACATPTRLDDGGRARRCPRCEAVFYPQLAPAMMVLVTRHGPAGRELLLARGSRFPTPIYSALAGFVEPSETLEESVHREVREEVGIEVRGLRYFGSQCWPFPHSLMVAFLAEHAGGEIRCEPAEIVDAQWFPVDRLPLLPHRLSVARRLIEHAVQEAAATSPPVPPRA